MFENSKVIKDINTCLSKISKDKEMIEELNFDISVYENKINSLLKDIPMLVPSKALEILYNNFHKDNSNNEKYKAAYNTILLFIKNYIIKDTDCDYDENNLISNIILLGSTYTIYFYINDIEMVLDIPDTSKGKYNTCNGGMYGISYNKGNNNFETIIFTFDPDRLGEQFKYFIEEKVYGTDITLV